MNVSRTVIRRDDYRPPEFLVEHVALEFRLDPEYTLVEARMSLRRNPAAEGTASLWLDGDNLCLNHLSLDGRELDSGDYEHEEQGLRIHGVPQEFELFTQVSLCPRENSALMGLYASGNLLCTQCEPEAFRRITFFPDRPDVMARFTTTLVGEAQRFPVLLSNGNPGPVERFDDGWHRITWEDPFPRPAYLFALVAGNLHRESRHFVTASGREVSLDMYVEPHNRDGCDWALDVLARAMAWDERRYGREYDLDVFSIVAVAQYTMSAMENKGLNIFNDRYVVAHSATATDDDYRAIEALVAHEYFHNWSGNRVTCRDWFQLGLKEGFTVYREQQFVSEQGYGPLRRVEDMKLMRTRQFAEDAGPLAHPVRPESYEEVDNFYSDTVYSKGAELIRMVALVIGEEAFSEGASLYFQQYDGQAVTLEQFFACMEEASGRDLSGYLRWFAQPGTPMLRVSSEYDQREGHCRVHLEQESARAGAAMLPVPLSFALLDESGAMMSFAVQSDAGKPDRHADGTCTLEMVQRTESLLCTGLAAPPVLSLLRGFSAPVKLESDFGDQHLVLLASHDTDACVRVDAMERLACRAIEAVFGETSGNALQAPDQEPLARAMHSLLEAGEGAPGLTAVLLELPGVARLTQVLGVTDPETLHQARARVHAWLGVPLAEQWRRWYRFLGERESPGSGVSAMGLRALRNRLLTLLVAAGDECAVELCARQYQQGETLTERLAALALLADGDSEQGMQALEAFRCRWHDNDLMLERWFRLQACATGGDTLARVKALTADEGFSLDHPNRVRSLIGAFCEDNPVHFHRADGEGYRFLTEQVLAVDRRNPQLAASLARNLLDGPRHGGAQSEAVRECLKHIRGQPGISRGLRELASASL